MMTVGSFELARMTPADRTWKFVRGSQSLVDAGRGGSRFPQKRDRLSG
jgi:hypothetical protein